MLTLQTLKSEFNSLPLDRLTEDGITGNDANEVLYNLIAFRNLLDSCCNMVDWALAQLGIIPSDANFYVNWHSRSADNIKLLACDWTFIARKFVSFNSNTEASLNSFMTTLQVQDSKRIDYIKKLGSAFVLVYTPLSVAYGILSMGGEFAPGQRHFWIFWVVAIPLIAITILLLLAWKRATGVLLPNDVDEYPHLGNIDGDENPPTVEREERRPTISRYRRRREI